MVKVSYADARAWHKGIEKARNEKPAPRVCRGAGDGHISNGLGADRRDQR
jgi:hypothetical protein